MYKGESKVFLYFYMCWFAVHISHDQNCLSHGSYSLWLVACWSLMCGYIFCFTIRVIWMWNVIHFRSFCVTSSNWTKIVEVTKNYCCVKDEGTVDNRKETKWFQKFHSSCYNLDDQARASRYKTSHKGKSSEKDTNNIVQAQQSTVHYNFGKIIQSSGIVSHKLPKYCKTFHSSECTSFYFIFCVLLVGYK